MRIKNCLALAITVLLVLAATLSAGEQIFTFAPSDSFSFEQHVYTEHVRSADNQQGLVDSIKAFYQKQFVRSPIGYDLVTVPDSIITNRNGKPIDSPISRAMAKTTSRMVLDDDGHCLSIEGYDKLEDNLSVDDSSLIVTIKQNLNPQAMGMKEAGEWNSLIDPLVGVKLALGDLMYVKEAFRVGAASSIDLYTLIECVDTFRVDSVLCARVYIHSDSDFLRLATRRKVTSEQLLADFTLDTMPVTPVGTRAMRVVQMVLEVPTMNLLGVLSKTEITRASTDESGEAHSIRLTETKDIRIFFKQAR